MIKPSHGMARGMVLLLPIRAVLVAAQIVNPIITAQLSP